MASIAELAHGEKSHTQPITQSASSFDALGTEACTSEYFKLHSFCFNLLIS